jgi:predicted branched-subunit amino acid permease
MTAWLSRARATARRYWQHPEFKVGLRDILTVAPGIAAWGLTTGVALANSGLSILEASAMTLVVFAGSAQLATTPLIVSGAPLWVIWATALCVNLRFVVFSAHMRPYFMHMPRRVRLVYCYLLGDMSYVLFTKRYHQPGQTPEQRLGQQAYWVASVVTNWVSWMGASFVGIALASVIPLSWGLGFAGILALIGIACSLATTKLRMLAAGLSGTAAVAAFALPLKLNIVVAIAAAVAMSLMIEHTRRAMSRDKEAA